MVNELSGYSIYGEPNGSIAFQDPTDVLRCAVCGELLCKWDEALDGLVLDVRQYDLSQTTDGIQIASHRFLATVQSAGLGGLEFRPLPDDPEFLAVRATEVVQFDYERRQTRFLHHCEACDRYKDIVGASPVFLREGSCIPELGFVRSDLEFGSGDGKTPLLLCGIRAGKVLKDARLKGVYVLPLKRSPV